MENQDSIYLFLDIIGEVWSGNWCDDGALFCGDAGKLIFDELYTAPGDYKYYDNGLTSPRFQ